MQQPTAENNPFRTLYALAIVVLLVAGPVFAADAPWQVGLARADITPEQPIRMAGYASRTEPSKGISTRLHAKALALRDAGGNRALLITADTLGIPAEIADRICARIRENNGLERSHILLNASHTHAGPLIMARPSYSATSEQVRVIDAYRAGFEDALVRIAGEALESMQPGHLSWSVGTADFVMNRREFTPKGVILGVNPRGPADRSVPVMRVEALDGRLLAILFGAACHNTTLTGNNQVIDGDYAGHAQLHLEEQYPGIQAMFLTGCGGDANPFPRGTLELARRHGEALGKEVVRVLGEKLKPVRGPIRSELRQVSLPLRQLTRGQIEQLAEGASSYRFFTTGALARLDRGEPLSISYTAPFALWQFGSDLTLVGFSGETVVDYALLTEQILGPLNLWVAGYCNDVYGYLVTTRLLKEGGYETRGLYTSLGLFVPGVEEIIMSVIQDMAQAAGRPAI